jgi:hypothetical protein
MLFEELHAVRPVRIAAAKGGTKIPHRHMFLIEKLLACGAFKKMKAHLVADGRDQDATMYPNKSSPTALVHTVYIVLGWATTLKWCSMGKIDIKGAFVQTPMTGEPVYMRIAPKIVRFFCGEGGNNGSTEEKATYGCVKASSLRFALLTMVLWSIGYEPSPTDPCVVHKIKGGWIDLILNYVDDMLVIADAREFALLMKTLEGKFGKISIELSRKLSYLGMQIEMTFGEALVNMSFCC